MVKYLQWIITGEVRSSYYPNFTIITDLSIYIITINTGREYLDLLRLFTLTRMPESACREYIYLWYADTLLFTRCINIISYLDCVEVGWLKQDYKDFWF